jgi:hypothetical protein
MRQNRYPILLNRNYPPERDVLNAISAVPEGERSGYLRALILLGHEQIQKDPLVAGGPAQPTQGEAADGAGTH